MKYTAGGITGNLGQALVVEVPIAGKPLPPQNQNQGQGQGQGQDQGGAKQDAQPAGPVAKESGDDVMVDPPVRNLPQWDPNRWGPTRMAGPKTGVMLNWTENGCKASTAAMTLRWFAEDCPAGKIPFPTKAGGSIKPDWYGPRMGECFWPNADPPGKIALSDSG